MLLPYFDAKRKINDRLGLRFGFTYQAVFLAATAGITDSSQTTSAGGVLSIPISWTLFGRDTGWSGTFTIMPESRHVYGFDVSPQNLGFETGTTLPTAVKFSSMSFRALVMHWGQELFDGQVGVVLGKVAPDDYFNSYRWIHPFMNFWGYANSINSTINWPNPGFGIGAGVKITDQWYVKGMLTDAGGMRFDDPGFFNFGNNFFDGRFFTSAEVGWVTSWSERFSNRIALTVAHSDAYEQSPDSNWGVALATNWTLDRWVPFLLAGVGNGKGENVVSKSTLTLGTGYTFRTHDVLGSSFNYTHPPGGLRDQYTVEVFYRYYLSEKLAMTPDIQLVFDPSLNPDKSAIVYFGIRARADL